MSQTLDDTAVLSGTELILPQGPVRLPRVNLLPPEILEVRSVRRAQVGLGAAVAASLLVVGGLWGLASIDQASAQQDLDAASARQTAVNRETGALADVAATYTQIQQRRTVLSSAMSGEVLWSQYLTDLALLVPDNVWLEKMSVAPVTAATAPGSTGVAGTPGFGPQTAAGAIATITFTGRAISQDDVTNWLQSISRGKGFTNVYFTDSTLQKYGEKAKAVQFTSTVSVMPEALSNRYPSSSGN
jgi:Tfp pilus assembly protein PilN